MTAQLFNNISDVLLNPVNSPDTEIQIQSGNVPSISPGDYTPIYVIRSNGSFEIMHVTAVSGTTLTVLRAQEGTDPLVFESGVTVQIRPTRQSLLEMKPDIGEVTTATGTQTLAEAIDQRVISTPDVAGMRALAASDGLIATPLGVDGGRFSFVGQDLSAEVAVDVNAAIYVAPNADQTGTSGAWVRVDSLARDSRWYGLVSTTSQMQELADGEFYGGGRDTATVGDGYALTQDGEAIQSISGRVLFDTPVQIDGYGVKFSQTETPISTFEFYQDSTTDIDRPLLQRVHITAPFNPAPGPGEDNGQYPLRFRGCIRPTAIANFIDSSALGIQQIFGDISLADRSGKYGLIALNHFYNIQQIAVEVGSSQHTTVVGNVVEGNNRGGAGNSHAFRLTGRDSTYFANDNMVARNTASCLAGNTASGMKDGLSVQNTVEAASVAAMTITDCDYALFGIASTAVGNNQAANYFQFTAKDVDTVIYNPTIGHSTFEFAARDITGTNPAIEELAPTIGEGKNHYRGILKDCAGPGAIFRHGDCQFQITVDGAVGNGVSLSTGANRSTGSISAFNCTGAGVLVSSDNNNLQITTIGNAGAYGISVTGGKNVLSIFSDTDVIVTGNSNMITGSGHGAIRVDGDNNKILGTFSSTVDNGVGNTFL